MIVGSILLVVVAVGLLIAGLTKHSNSMFYASIVTSALAAFTLIIGARQVVAAHSDENDDFDLGPATVDPAGDAATASEAAPGATRGRRYPRRGAGGPVSAQAPAERVPDQGDPLDEPAAERVTPADAAIVARLDAEVLVIDGRPRYHCEGCLHLLGRESERVPVREAVELGFTPCSLCEPGRVLVAQTRRA